jgi:hypothetical protein
MYEKVKNPAIYSETASVRETPDFHQILSSLTEEVNSSRELMYRTYDLTTSLKPLPVEKSEVVTPKSKEPEGIIDLLWEQIWTLRDINQSLNKSVNHLNSLIK